jgi:hypothetical protein
MSELKEIQAAAAKVMIDTEEAYRRGELDDSIAVGFRLDLVMHCMKSAHQPGARKIVREFCEQVGIDFDELDGQARGRIYEHIQISRLEDQLEDKS